MEIRYIRMLANLCSLTYTMARMTVSSSNRRNLNFSFQMLGLAAYDYFHH